MKRIAALLAVLPLSLALTSAVVIAQTPTPTSIAGGTVGTPIVTRPAATLLSTPTPPPMPERGKSFAHDGATSSPYKAYWATRKDHLGYTELVFARRPLNEMPKAAVPLDKPLFKYEGIIVTTYAKDSIWNIDGKPFKPLAEVEKVGAKSITIKGREFVYTEAKMEDVLRLLENPGGKIAIHRIYGPVNGQEEFVKSLAQRIRQQVDEMKKESNQQPNQPDHH